MIFALLSSPPGDKSVSDDSGNVGGEDHSLVCRAWRPGQGRSGDGVFKDSSGPGDVRCELLHDPGVWKPLRVPRA